jgi:hypothetical protein
MNTPLNEKLDELAQTAALLQSAADAVRREAVKSNPLFHDAFLRDIAELASMKCRFDTYFSASKQEP